MSDLFQQTLAHFSRFVEFRAFLGVVISFFQSAAFQVVIGEETARDGKGGEENCGRAAVFILTMISTQIVIDRTTMHR